VWKQPRVWLVVAFAFFVGCTFTTLRGTTAQDTDADRIAALEAQVAGLQGSLRSQRNINEDLDGRLDSLTDDVTSIVIDLQDQTLPEPRPESDFTSPYRITFNDDNSFRLFCRPSTKFDRYADMTCSLVAP
jgi:hypothetical protein